MKVPGNGIELNVEVSGDGPAVLLLHGFPDSHRLWRNQTGFLNDNGFTTIAPDHRAYELPVVLRQPALGQPFELEHEHVPGARVLLPSGRLQ